MKFEVKHLPMDSLHEAPWNPNRMDQETEARLRTSLTRYGLVENLVVRPLSKGTYEVLSGNQRLRVLKGLGFDRAPCFVAALDDVHARLLAQALNRLRGEDDLGLKAELVRKVLSAVPEEQMLSLLPETAESLRALASLAESDMMEHLQAWQAAQAARLKHLQLQLTGTQMEVVVEALERAMAGSTKDGANPNRRGNAIFAICKAYLESEGLYTPGNTKGGVR